MSNKTYKEVRLSNKDYELTIMLVKNILSNYERDLSKYETLLDNKKFDTIEMLDDKPITLNEEILLEEKDFLTPEIRKTKQLLANLKNNVEEVDFI